MTLGNNSGSDIIGISIKRQMLMLRIERLLFVYLDVRRANQLSYTLYKEKRIFIQSQRTNWESSGLEMSWANDSRREHTLFLYEGIHTLSYSLWLVPSCLPAHGYVFVWFFKYDVMCLDCWISDWGEQRVFGFVRNFTKCSTSTRYIREGLFVGIWCHIQH